MVRVRVRVRVDEAERVVNLLTMLFQVLGSCFVVRSNS